jgi:hypothetical protein
VDVAEATVGELAELIAGAGRPYEVAAAVLDELRERPPTVLVLEDLQWADEATLDVITLLVTRIASVPALALASYRDDELHRAPGLRLVLGEVAVRSARFAAAVAGWGSGASRAASTPPGRALRAHGRQSVLRDRGTCGRR